MNDAFAGDRERRSRERDEGVETSSESNPGRERHAREQPAVGGGGSIAWTPAPFRIEAAASAWTAQSSTVAASDAGARFAMTALSGSACASVWRRAIEVAPCGGGSGPLVYARGFGAPR